MASSLYDKPCTLMTGTGLGDKNEEMVLADMGTPRSDTGDAGRGALEGYDQG